MKGFQQGKSDYSEDAMNVVFSANDTYDLSRLDNPVRKRVNYALIQANCQSYKREVTL